MDDDKTAVSAKGAESAQKALRWKQQGNVQDKAALFKECAKFKRDSLCAVRRRPDPMTHLLGGHHVTHPDAPLGGAQVLTGLIVKSILIKE